jgi:hypothetical protein
MNKTWETPGDAYIDIALALKELENHLYEMGGRMGKLENVSYNPDGYPDGYIEVTTSFGFSGQELREYISRLPPHVSGKTQG